MENCILVTHQGLHARPTIERMFYDSFIDLIENITRHGETGCIVNVGHKIKSPSQRILTIFPVPMNLLEKLERNEQPAAFIFELAEDFSNAKVEKFCGMIQTKTFPASLDLTKMFKPTTLTDDEVIKTIRDVLNDAGDDLIMGKLADALRGKLADALKKFKPTKSGLSSTTIEDILEQAKRNKN